MQIIYFLSCDIYIWFAKLRSGNANYIFLLCDIYIWFAKSPSGNANYILFILCYVHVHKYKFAKSWYE